jgi:hypothetical protein
MIVKIDPEFERISLEEFALSAEETAQLRANLIRDGCRDSLRIWDSEGILIDGHNRYRLCKELGIEFGTTPITLGSREAARAWIYANQLGRRNLTDDQRAIIAGRLANETSAINKITAAAIATEAAAKARRGEKSDAVKIAATDEKRDRSKVQKEAAKTAKVRVQKVRDAQKIEKKAPELAKKVLKGETSLAQAVKEVKKQEQAEKDETPVAPKHGHNPNRELLERLHELNTPRFLQTLKASPPTDSQKEQLTLAVRRAIKILCDIQERLSL